MVNEINIDACYQIVFDALWLKGWKWQRCMKKI